MLKFIAFILLITPGVSISSDFSIKEFMIGDQLTELKAVESNPFCSTYKVGSVEEPRVKLCIVKENILGEERNIHLRYLDGVLGYISFDLDPDNYQKNLEIFYHKFGSPQSSDKSKIQTRIGSSYTNILTTWKNGEVIARFQKYANNITKSVLQVASEKHMLDVAALSKAMKKKAAAEF